MPKTTGALRWVTWRKANGLTQAAAAYRLGVDPWYIAKIEQGRRKPGRGISVRMRDLAGIDPAEWDRMPEPRPRPRPRRRRTPAALATG